MLKIIAAHDPNRVIGKGKVMPWNVPQEFALFREKTIGGVIVLGLPTVEGMGKLLPGRKTIILSKDNIKYQGAEVVNSIEEIVKRSKREDIWIGGGALVFKLFMEYVDEMHISIMKSEYDGDIEFPSYDLKLWNIKEKKEYKEFNHFVFKRK